MSHTQSVILSLIHYTKAHTDIMDAMFKLTESQQRQAKWIHEFLKYRSYRCTGNPKPYYRCDFCVGVMVAESDWASHCDADHHITNVKIIKVRPH